MAWDTSKPEIFRIRWGLRFPAVFAQDHTAVIWHCQGLRIASVSSFSSSAFMAELAHGFWPASAYVSPHRVQRTIEAMALTLRSYEPHDFATLYRLDQSCFAPGIAYSKNTLRYFLTQPGADCLVAMQDNAIVGFILTEENAPLAHIITLDVAEKFRRLGIGSMLLAESERNLSLRGVRHVLLESATDNSSAVAFWQRHGYRTEVVLKRYYMGRVDAYEMRKILPASTSEESVHKKQASAVKKTVP